MKHHLRRLLAAVCAAAALTGTASALTTPQAVELLEQYYVDELPAPAYQAETLDQLFSVLGDPYTYYMDAEQYRAFISSVEGDTRVGIGVAITYTNEGILINSIVPGGSAGDAGLEAGDTIVAIDGVSCVPAQESDVARITGEEGTVVSLDILRRDGRRESVPVVRRQFTIPTTTVSLLEDGVGYIDCSSFSSSTGADFTDGVAEYGDRADLWLVDLRGNLGGVTDGALGAIGVFTGPVIPLYFRDGDGAYYPFVSSAQCGTQAPAVVLSDSYTASASEIFSSAIKDYGAGIVLGGRTYGKGVAQIILDENSDPDLFDGDCLKITTYRFYTGAANTTDSVGVFPTLLLRDGHTENAARLLRAAEPDTPAGWLRLSLGGWRFYVDAAAALRNEADAAALAEIFAALPPDVEAAVGTADAWVLMDAPHAAAALGVDYTSRWFTDVDDSPYADALNTLGAYGILRGVGDGSFLPRNTLSRAELCSLLCLTLDRVSSSPSPFSDVPDDSWYAPYVAAMYETGLVQGRGGGVFGPDDTLSQQEFITVLGRLASFLNANCRESLASAELYPPEDAVLERFAPWARDCAWLLGLSLLDDVTGEPVSMLHTTLEDIDPAAPILREEAGASLYTLLTTLGILSW